MKTRNSGEGHKARIALVAKVAIDMDGKKQSFNIDYDVTITVEMIEYAIREIAGGIAQAASKIARDGFSGDPAKEKTPESVTA